MIVMKIIVMNFCLLELFEDQDSACQVINTLLTGKAAKKYEFFAVVEKQKYKSFSAFSILFSVMPPS